MTARASGQVMGPNLKFDCSMFRCRDQPDKFNGTDLYYRYDMHSMSALELAMYCMQGVSYSPSGHYSPQRMEQATDIVLTGCSGM